jgi:hypothetical protein
VLSDQDLNSSLIIQILSYDTKSEQCRILSEATDVFGKSRILILMLIKETV